MYIYIYIYYCWMSFHLCPLSHHLGVNRTMNSRVWQEQEERQQLMVRYEEVMKIVAFFLHVAQKWVDGWVVRSRKLGFKFVYSLQLYIYIIIVYKEILYWRWWTCSVSIVLLIHRLSSDWTGQSLEPSEWSETTYQDAGASSLKGWVMLSWQRFLSTLLVFVFLELTPDF